MNFSTPVELPKGLPPITHAQQLLLMGSCFAENIGRQLKENSFHCDVNPFGILYNPFSVLEALQEILSGKQYTASDLFFFRDCWHSPGLFQQFRLRRRCSRSMIVYGKLTTG